MRVGVIDVGSNTVRLLVAAGAAGGELRTVAERRLQLGLGEEIERHGRIRRAKLKATAGAARGYAREARTHGAQVVEAVVTAPGRQSSNAAELVEALRHASGVPVCVLSAEEEGRMAYRGAAACRLQPGRVAVCDVGGGSTELVVGEAGSGVEWLRSYEIGSLRLTRRAFGDRRPTGRALRAARKAVRRELTDAPPPVASALAAGGTARALRRIAGRTLGPAELDRALDRAVRLSPAALRRRYGIEPERGRTLAAGALVLYEVASLLGVPLEVARGGLREGVAAGMLDRLAEHAA